MAKRKSRVTPGTPAAVSKAAATAEEIHKQVYGDSPEDTVEEAGAAQAAPAEDSTGEGGDIQPVEPQAQTDSTGDTQDVAPPTQTETGAEVTEVTPSNPEPASDPAPADDWEQKYKALQGKYNAEVPRMAADIRSLREEMEANKVAPAPAPETTPEKKPVVTDADLVDYGEDLVDLIRRVARDESSVFAEQLTPKIEQIQGQVQTSAKAQATNSVYGKLDSEVQDWRNINKSPEFITWLNESDPYVGDVRSNLLSDAFKKGDANRVAAFFKGYLAESRVVTPTPPPSAQAPAPATESAPQGQMTLEQLAGPAGGPSMSEQSTQPKQAPSWTRAQIATFYADVQKGHYEKNPAKKAQIENSIALAMQENRIE